MSRLQENYKKVRVVGSGSFGHALLCKRNRDAKEVVIKVLIPRPKEGRAKVINEVRILKTLNHPNIIGFIEAWREGEKIYISMEYAEDGDLRSLIVAQKTSGNRLPETLIRSYMMQLACALYYIHSVHILHRDMKSENIFIAVSGKVLKLGDFGISKQLSSSIDFAHTAIGTPYYMSPEIVTGRRYNAKSDIWAAGIILHELLTFEYPFKASNQEALFHLIRLGRHSKEREAAKQLYSSDIISLMNSMLEIDSKKRLSSRRILQHPALRNDIQLQTPKVVPRPALEPAVAGEPTAPVDRHRQVKEGLENTEPLKEIINKKPNYDRRAYLIERHINNNIPKPNNPKDNQKSDVNTKPKLTSRPISAEEVTKIERRIHDIKTPSAYEQRLLALHRRREATKKVVSNGNIEATIQTPATHEQRLEREHINRREVVNEDVRVVGNIKTPAHETSHQNEERNQKEATNQNRLRHCDATERRMRNKYSTAAILQQSDNQKTVAVDQHDVRKSEVTSSKHPQEGKSTAKNRTNEIRGVPASRPRDVWLGRKCNSENNKKPPLSNRPVKQDSQAQQEMNAINNKLRDIMARYSFSEDQVKEKIKRANSSSRKDYPDATGLEDGITLKSESPPTLQRSRSQPISDRRHMAGVLGRSRSAPVVTQLDDTANRQRPTRESVVVSRSVDPISGHGFNVESPKSSFKNSRSLISNKEHSEAKGLRDKLFVKKMPISQYGCRIPVFVTISAVTASLVVMSLSVNSSWKAVNIPRRQHCTGIDNVIMPILAKDMLNTVIKSMSETLEEIDALSAGDSQDEDFEDYMPELVAALPAFPPKHNIPGISSSDTVHTQAEGLFKFLEIKLSSPTLCHFLNIISNDPHARVHSKVLNILEKEQTHYYCLIVQLAKYIKHTNIDQGRYRELRKCR